MEIHEERPEDIEAIHRVNEQAFGQPTEARLVDALRRAGQAVVSLVALENGLVVGHILFGPVNPRRSVRLEVNGSILNIPNWKSDTEGVSLAVFDY